MAYVSREDSYQTRQTPHLNSVFADGMKKTWFIRYSLSRQVITIIESEMQEKSGENSGFCRTKSINVAFPHRCKMINITSSPNSDDHSTESQQVIKIF